MSPRRHTPRALEPTSGVPPCAPLVSQGLTSGAILSPERRLSARRRMGRLQHMLHSEDLIWLQPDHGCVVQRDHPYAVHMGPALVSLIEHNPSKPLTHKV